MRASIDEVPHGSPAQAAFSAELSSDIAGAVTHTLAAQGKLLDGQPVAVERLRVVRIDSGHSSSANVSIHVQLEVLPAASARAPSIAIVAATLEDLVLLPRGPLFDTSRVVSSRIDRRRAPTVREGFSVFPVFARLSIRGGPTEGGTLVGLVGDGMDAFNYDNQAAIRCRWGVEDKGEVAPELFSATLIQCRTTPVLMPGIRRLYVSLNGIAPFQDTGLDFIDYRDPPAVNFYQIEPTGGPTAGGTPVTIRAQGLDAIGGYVPPATGDARCRWGRPWMVEIEGDVIQYTDAVAVDGGGLVCPTPAIGANWDELVAVAINGQQFIMAGSLGVRFYRQPRTLELVSGRLRGPSSGGTRWELYDHRGWLLNFAHTKERLRYCRWGQSGVTVAGVDPTHRPGPPIDGYPPRSTDDAELVR